MEIDKNAQIVIAVGIVAIVGGVLYYVINEVEDVTDSVGGALGLTPDATDKAQQTAYDAVSSGGNDWNSLVWAPSKFWPQLAKKYPTTKYGRPLITAKNSQDRAAEIWGAIGVFYDSEEVILNTIKKQKNKMQIAMVVEAFQYKYNKDLLEWLRDKLDQDNEQKVFVKIIQYVNSLPLGIYDLKDKSKKTLY